MCLQLHLCLTRSLFLKALLTDRIYVFIYNFVNIDPQPKTLLLPFFFLRIDVRLSKLATENIPLPWILFLPLVAVAVHWKLTLEPCKG